MPEQSQFLFITCQVGAEPALKRELAKYRPGFRFAYSRPGFLTFKLPEKHGLKDDFDLKAIFARAYGFSLGKVELPASFVCTASLGPTLVGPAEEVWKLAGEREFDALHVWPRDRYAPGHHDYEVQQTAESLAADAAIRAAAPERSAAVKSKRFTNKGDRVLDVVLVEPNQWWVGFHRAGTLPTCRPGGIFEEIQLPPDAVSRAYLKLEEGLKWSGLPVEAGDHAAEIGCAPGGACQALLNRGLLVTGIDPADIDPYVAANPNFRHLKMRGSDVKRREFAGVKWLMTDMNVAPKYTLDTVETIVTHPDVNIEGLLLTLKLLDWDQADDAAEYVSRVQSWGFGKVHCRQLQNNRREFCLAAQRTTSAEPLANLEKRAARKLAKLIKPAGGEPKQAPRISEPMKTEAPVLAEAVAKSQAAVISQATGAEVHRPSERKQKTSQKPRYGKRMTNEQEGLSEEQLAWNNREVAKPEPRRSKSKEIFAAKQKTPVPVKKSRPEPQAPTKHPKGAPSSAAEAKEAPKGTPPKAKLGLERKAALNAKQQERLPVPKVGARGVKARPRPVPKKKRN
jgi:23S rRNA (cytidine2498-2'-O)-methyltransferase